MISVVVPASGSGTRFGEKLPKQFCQVAGQDLLWHTLHKFQQMDCIDEIVPVIPPGYTQRVAGYPFAKISTIVAGGESRGHSIYNGLQGVNPACRIVLIHDGARPLVQAQDVENLIAAVKKHHAAILATPVTDTIKAVLQHEGNMTITQTVDRANLWQAQTPQGFTYQLILDAYQQNIKDGTLHLQTDDSSLIENTGHPVHIVSGSPGNIKITTKADMSYLEKEFI